MIESRPISTHSGLNVPQVNDEDAGAEWSKLGRIKAVRTDRRYSTDAYLSSPAYTARKPVASLPEARLALRLAATKRDVSAVPAERVLQARTPPRAPDRLRRIHPCALRCVRGQAIAYLRTLPLDRRMNVDVATASTAGAARLGGQWRLGLSAPRGAKTIDFAPEESTCTLEFSDGPSGSAVKATFERFERSSPLLPALTRTVGRVEFGAARDGGSGEGSGEGSGGGGGGPVLRFAAESASIGPLPVPAGGSFIERLLYFDSIVCVVDEIVGDRDPVGDTPYARTAVWVRPRPVE